MEESGYRKSYRLRMSIPGKNSVEVTFPYVVVEREARRRGMSVPDFLKAFQVIAEYNNWEGVRYTFEPAPLRVGQDLTTQPERSKFSQGVGP